MNDSGNPALSKSAMARLRSLEASKTATVGGTISKIVLLLAILTGGAVVGWRMAMNSPETVGVLLIASIVGASIAALVTIFVPRVAAFTSPIYALLEGVLLGAISMWMDEAYGGIVLQAIVLTLGVLASTLFLYSTGMVRVTEKMRSIILIATLGIALYYVINLVFTFFGSSLPLIYDSGTGGIIFSLIVVGIASLNLLLDYDFIDRAAKGNLPKQFEWYGAFSLLVTLVWLYIEILRLLGKTKN